MPTISVTFDVPDTLPAEQIQRLIAQVNSFAVASAQKATASVSGDAATDAPWDVDDAQFSAPDADGLYSSLLFAGVGKDQPGAVGDDVEKYLRDLRDEWDERDAQ